MIYSSVFFFIISGMCMLVATLAQVQNTGQWTGRRKFFVAFSCCFITLGTFIFGLTLAQSIMNFTNGGIKADKSKYTC
jgi:formate-dependent nitrite reductase membrane component NrfD